MTDLPRKQCIVCGRVDELESLYSSKLPEAQPVAYAHFECLCDDAPKGETSGEDLTTLEHKPSKVLSRGSKVRTQRINNESRPQHEEDTGG
jgi:hypothetical protein